MGPRIKGSIYLLHQTQKTTKGVALSHSDHCLQVILIYLKDKTSKQKLNNIVQCGEECIGETTTQAATQMAQHRTATSTGQDRPYT